MQRRVSSSLTDTYTVPRCPVQCKAVQYNICCRSTRLRPHVSQTITLVPFASSGWHLRPAHRASLSTLTHGLPHRIRPPDHHHRRGRHNRRLDRLPPLPALAPRRPPRAALARLRRLGPRGRLPSAGLVRHLRAAPAGAPLLPHARRPLRDAPLDRLPRPLGLLGVAGEPPRAAVAPPPARRARAAARVARRRRAARRGPAPHRHGAHRRAGAPAQAHAGAAGARARERRHQC